jgi:hypothetical protein
MDFPPGKEKKERAVFFSVGENDLDIVGIVNHSLDDFHRKKDIDLERKSLAVTRQNRLIRRKNFLAVLQDFHVEQGRQSLAFRAGQVESQ